MYFFLNVKTFSSEEPLLKEHKILFFYFSLEGIQLLIHLYNASPLMLFPKIVQTWAQFTIPFLAPISSSS